jgi:triosephosphate isomerase
MAAERKFFVGGNWKMNGTKSSIDTIIGFLKDGPLSSSTGMMKNKLCNVLNKTISVDLTW